jgi:hypothetical protein
MSNAIWQKRFTLLNDARAMPRDAKIYVVASEKREVARRIVWFRSGPVEMHPTSTPV